ncbi:MAG TPA: flagellar basal body rod protein FlgB [Terracidiphilus sp.]|nr:flagellar basal body rod protein FlgB [Terracidiphilus sp.]
MELPISTRLSEQLTRYLDLAATQAKLTAVNMANIDTPGYRAIGMDFNAEMQNALQSVDSREPSFPAHVTLTEGLVARPDGNNVSMDREGMNLAESQLKFKTGIALLRQEYQRVMDAIHADGK